MEYKFNAEHATLACIEWIRKFFEETVLEEQAFIKDSGLTVKAYLENNNSKLVKLVKFEVGEGMEKRTDNFAEEVMSQIK